MSRSAAATSRDRRWSARSTASIRRGTRSGTELLTLTATSPEPGSAGTDQNSSTSASSHRAGRSPRPNRPRTTLHRGWPHRRDEPALPGPAATPHPRATTRPRPAAASTPTPGQPTQRANPAASSIATAHSTRSSRRAAHQPGYGEFVHDRNSGLGCGRETVKQDDRRSRSVACLESLERHRPRRDIHLSHIGHVASAFASASKSTALSATCSPTLAPTSVTVPAWAARSESSIFMAPIVPRT